MEKKMNTNRWLIVLGILMTSFLACSNGGKVPAELPLSFKVSVTNPSEIDRLDVQVELRFADIVNKHPDFNPSAWGIFSDGMEIPSQLNTANSETTLIFVADFKAGQKRNFTIGYAKTGTRAVTFTKRTQAELSHKVGGRFVKRVYEGGQFQNVNYLRVPPEHTDHSWYIRYEGPGWESDKVGYRFYLDWRNAIDIFGKKTPDMVLQDVGQDGFDSYHSMCPWGMDILKVGESLGIGSLAMWLNEKAERVAVTDSIICEIVQNGPVRSQIRTHYFGWKIGDEKYDLVSDLSITAGSRLTRHIVRMNGEPPNLCTGIVKLENVTLLSSTDKNRDWMYLGTYGKQSLAEDKLGMAVLFRRQDLAQITSDTNSYVVVLKPVNGTLTYYFLAAWEQEPNGITSESQFQNYLDETVTLLGQELKIVIN